MWFPISFRSIDSVAETVPPTLSGAYSLVSVVRSTGQPAVSPFSRCCAVYISSVPKIRRRLLIYGAKFLGIATRPRISLLARWCDVWPHVASPAWSSAEPVARPATKRFHASDWRPLEACCRPWTCWCNDATALAAYATVMMMMMMMWRLHPVCVSAGHLNAHSQLTNRTELNWTDWQDWCHGFPGLFNDTYERIRFFYFLVFLFSTFSWLIPCGRLSWLMSAFKRTLKQYLVSYRIE